MKQLAENINSVDVEITAELIDEIYRIHTLYKNPAAA